MLRAVLELEGYEVMEAANGAEGLRRYQGAPTDLVITDLQMPVMDGLALLRELRRAFPWVKVLAMSGNWRMLRQARPLTPYTLEKPLSLALVRATVSRALQYGRGDQVP